MSEETLEPQGFSTYDLIRLKGSTQLLVAPLGQDFIEGKLVRTPAAFPCLTGQVQTAWKETRGEDWTDIAADTGQAGTQI